MFFLNYLEPCECCIRLWFMSVSGSLGVPKIKISAVELSRLRSGSLQIPHSQRSLFVQRPVKYLSLRTSVGSLKAVQLSTVTAAETAGTFIISLMFFSAILLFMF